MASKPRHRFKFHSFSWEWSIFAGFLISISILVWGPWCTIKDITCVDSLGNTCSPELMQWLNQYQQYRLWLIRPKDISRSLLRLFPYFDQAIVRVSWPHTLTVNVAYAEAAAVLVDSSAHQWVVSRQAVLLPMQNQHVPHITLAYSLTWDGETSSVAKTIVDLLKLLEENAISFSSMSSDEPTTFKVQINSHLEVLFTSTTDLSRQVATLQAILPAATMKTDQLVLDLRFSKPVIKPATDSGRIKE